MSDLQHVKPPIWFWIVAVLFVLWNLFGVSNYLMSVMATTESLTAQGYTPEQVAFLLDIPPLYASVFALAVWSGLLASILLLLRRRWAVPIYLISLGFVALSFIFDVVGGTFTVLGTPYIVIMVVVLILAAVEYILARNFRSRGWLK